MGQSLENDTQGFLWTLLLSRAMLPCAMLPHTRIKSQVGESGIGQQHARPSIGVFSDASTNEWAEFCTLCHHLLHITGTQRSPKGAIRRSPRPLKNHPTQTIILIQASQSQQPGTYSQSRHTAAIWEKPLSTLQAHKLCRRRARSQTSLPSLCICASAEDTEVSSSPQTAGRANLAQSTP